MEIVVYAQLSSACIPGYDPKASDLFEPVTVLAVLPPPPLTNLGVGVRVVALGLL